MKKALIIGAGIGGLATAVRLAVKGYEVTVFEQSETPGGKIHEIRDGGFRWDTGPSLFTLPELVYDLFYLAGENPEDYLPYKRIDPVCQYFFPDGTFFKAYADSKKFASELEQKVGEPKHNTLQFLEKYGQLYDVAAPVFLFNSFHKIKNFNKPEFKRTLFQLHKLDSIKTMHARNHRWFKTKYATQLFDRYATYNGSNPYKSPATLNMIAHLEHNLGAFFPDKGMYQIAEAVYQLAIKKGVRFLFNSRVQQIETNKRKVSGIIANNSFFPADLLVSNVDATTFYNKLMPDLKKPRFVKNQALSSSGIIFYWGVDKIFPELSLHNILFSNNYEQEFKTIFDQRSIYEDPTVYIFISSKQVANDAPKGSENWFVMVNTPADEGQNWDELVNLTRHRIIQKINHQFNIQLEQAIIAEHIATPVIIEKQTSSWKGALYGNASNSKWSAFNRHPNFSRKFKNLFFVGGSVHPGGGIPLCLCSAKIVDDLIDD